MNSINNKRINKKIDCVSIFEDLFSQAFFLFFSIQILSPEINGRMLYIELILILLNPFFIRWCLTKKFSKDIVILIIPFSFIFLLNGFDIVIKLSGILLSVLFLFYSYERKRFYLNFWIMLSIFIAILQFLFFYINYEISYLLGPTNISKMVWGEYAAQTFTNFYTIFAFPRVSGLSRESGFFASFLVVYIVFIFLDKRKLNTLSTILLLVGFIISFSKISLVLIIVLMIFFLRKIVNSINMWVIFLFFYLVIHYITLYNMENILLPENESLFHRFGAYKALDGLDIEQLLFGVKSIVMLDNNIYEPLYKYDKFAGLGGYIFHNGILIFIFTVMIYHILKIQSIGVLLLLFLTLNVDLVTNQNFVVLSYFVVIKFFSKKYFIDIRC